MKKLLRMISVAFLSVAFITGTATAQTTIENTGPKSNNTIDVTKKEECKIKNNTDVKVDNNTNQNSQSGNANSSDGNASSGNASNNSSTNTNVDISNDANCKPEKDHGGNGGGTTPTGPAGGRGGGERGPMLAAAAGGRGAGEAMNVAALPETSADSLVAYAAIAAGVLATAAVASRLGLNLASTIKRK